MILSTLSRDKVLKIIGNARSVAFSDDLGDSDCGWGWLGPRWDQDPLQNQPNPQKCDTTSVSYDAEHFIPG